MNDVGLIDVFDPPFEVWSTRKPTKEEIDYHWRNYGRYVREVDDKLIESIGSARHAAEYMCRIAVDGALENFIDAALVDNDQYNEFRRLMPVSTPPALSDYQSRYPRFNQVLVEREIDEYGLLLAEGQKLFHGGDWSQGKDYVVTSRPFSTAFCPQIARRSAEGKGKAYDAGRIEITTLTVVSPRTKAYLFGPEGELGHEKEVLFASGATIRVTNRSLVGTSKAYKAGEYGAVISKDVPMYLIEAEIS